PTFAPSTTRTSVGQRRAFQSQESARVGVWSWGQSQAALVIGSADDRPLDASKMLLLAVVGGDLGRALFDRKARRTGALHGQLDLATGDHILRVHGTEPCFDIVGGNGRIAEHSGYTTHRGRGNRV